MYKILQRFRDFPSHGCAGPDSDNRGCKKISFSHLTGATDHVLDVIASAKELYTSLRSVVVKPDWRGWISKLPESDESFAALNQMGQQYKLQCLIFYFYNRIDWCANNTLWQQRGRCLGLSLSDIKRYFFEAAWAQLSWAGEIWEQQSKTETGATQQNNSALENRQQQKTKTQLRFLASGENL